MTPATARQLAATQLRQAAADALSIAASRETATGPADAMRATSSPPHITAAQARADLEALASDLNARGWITRLRAPRQRPPSLHVQNPDPGAAALNEHIYIGPDSDHTLWFWWPWADKITPAGDTVAAANAITRALRSAPDAAR